MHRERCYSTNLCKLRFVVRVAMGSYGFLVVWLSKPPARFRGEHQLLAVPSTSGCIRLAIMEAS